MKKYFALCLCTVIAIGSSGCASSGGSVSVGVDKEYKPVYTVPSSWNEGQIDVFESLIRYSEGQVRNSPEPDGDAACYEFNQEGRSIEYLVDLLDYRIEGRYPISDSEVRAMTREVVEAWAKLCPT